jgi:hypothetical protein
MHLIIWNVAAITSDYFGIYQYLISAEVPIAWIWMSDNCTFHPGIEKADNLTSLVDRALSKCD